MKKSGSLEKALQKQVQNHNKIVRVGFIDDATYPDGTPVAQVAFWNEYGTEKIPPRPFFRHTIAENKSKWVSDLVKLAEVHNKNQALALMGERIKGDFVQSINIWSEPPNAPYTVEKKGFNAPLRDTMVMARSISYEVDDES